MKARLGDYIHEFSARNSLSEDIPVYSVTNTQGFCRDYFGKEVASKDKSTYKIVPRGCFAYNPSRINVGSVDWQRREERVIVSPLYCVFSVSSELVKQYLYYYLKSDITLFYIKSIATGSVRDNLKLSMLYEFPINLPSIDEQKRIVKRLDTIREIIILRQQELQRLDELIKARFVEMFGEPNSNSMGWPMRKLGDCLSSIDGGKSLNCDNHPRNGDFPAVLKLSAVTYGTYNPRENKQLPKASDFIEDLAVHAGDLLFSRKNTYELVGMAAYVWETPPFLMLPDLIFRLNTNGTCRKVYLWQLINHPQFRKVIRGLANGSTGSMPNIAKQRLIEVSIPLPPVDRQIELEDFVSQVDKSKVVVQKWQEITGFQ